MFKLEENGRKLNCIINGTLKYIFARNSGNGDWEAFNVKDGEAFGMSVDSDKYRYDLAERLDLKK